MKASRIRNVLVPWKANIDQGVSKEQKKFVFPHLTDLYRIYSNNEEHLCIVRGHGDMLITALDIVGK